MGINNGVILFKKRCFSEDFSQLSDESIFIFLKSVEDLSSFLFISILGFISFFFDILLQLLESSHFLQPTEN